MLLILLRSWKLFVIPRVAAVYFHTSAIFFALISLIVTAHADVLMIWSGLWLAALVHGLGHAISARIRGQSPAELKIWPFFSTTRFARPPASRQTDMLICLSGPVTNCFMGLALLILARQLHGPGRHGVFLWAQYQVGYGLFCLLPIFPLDGSRLLRLGISYLKPQETALDIANFIGQSSAFGLLCWSLYQGRYKLAFVGFALFMIGQFAGFIQTVISQLNLMEVRMQEQEMAGDLEEDGAPPIVMTQTAEGVWQTAEPTSPSAESRTYF